MASSIPSTSTTPSIVLPDDTTGLAPKIMLCPGRWKPYYLLPNLQNAFVNSVWVWDCDHDEFLSVNIDTLRDVSLHHSSEEDHDDFILLHHNRFGLLYVTKEALGR